MSAAPQIFMKRTFELAQKGLGAVSPNPMVGCVIVHENKIVAEGWHEKYGEAHAEVNAIKRLPEEINPQDCELYVNLEPCSHHGKTPPCADLIVQKRFKKVIICNLDPNPLVAGKGIEKLKQAGAEVITGVLEEEGRFLNRRFFTYHEKKRPYVILKWAQTADGFISKWPVPENREENIISGKDAHRLSHQLRASEDAILVGKNTVLADNPELTARLAVGKHPVRVVLANDFADFKNYKVFNDAAKTIWYNAHENSAEGDLTKVKIAENKHALPFVLGDLYSRGIASVIVEGGREVLNSFISNSIWDEMWVFENPELTFGAGVKAPDFRLNTDYQLIGKDRWHVIYSKSII
jgi:diaminohydroxyphosphoribosylaminopyrimidine deaminase / 5-amino-6-(5-phosphoribosylamino)uracil reductase